MDLLIELWSKIKRKRKIQFLLTVILMVLSGISEIISIGAIIPLLISLENPNKIFQNPYIQPVIKILGYTEANQIQLPLIILFAVAVIVAGAMRILLIYAGGRLSFVVCADLGADIYGRTLSQPYEDILSRNSSFLISVLSTKINDVVYLVLNPVLSIISSSIISILILGSIFLYKPIVLMGTILYIGIIYICISFLVKNKLKENGQKISKRGQQIVQIVQEGIGSIRDIILDCTYNRYLRQYTICDAELRSAQSKNQFLTLSPRYLVETLSILTLVIYIFILTNKNIDLMDIIPFIGAFVISIQKLLPLVQNIFNGYSSIISGLGSLSDVIELLNQNLNKKNVNSYIKFNNEIKLQNVAFKYKNSDIYALKNINLIIKKGERIGFIGSTGSGKSTLLDIIMGLLLPTSGKLYIDDIEIDANNIAEWRALVAHVPQSIYLTDGSIADNITLSDGPDNIKVEKFKNVVAMAKIDKFVEKIAGGYAAIVGERGFMLSGGQRQRIGIARALYKRSELIVFDEATSSLDPITESEIMETVYDLDKYITILMVAHRILTLKNCNKIIRIENGEIFWFGKYSDLNEHR
jgi:ATP-binding cassette subfamily B protein